MNNYYVKACWDNKNNLQNKDLKELWLKIKNENIDKIVFYDCYMDFKQLKNLVYAEKNYFAVIYLKNEIKAFFWLNNFFGKTAMLHFSFFKKSLAEKYNIAEQVLNWCFKGGYENLYSLTPSIYLPTINFAINLKAKYLGELKEACFFIRANKYIDGSILSFKKEEK